VSSSGWVGVGMCLRAFNRLVRSKWSEWEEGRGKAAAARQDEERKLLERQKALLEWLTELGLEGLHSCLIREGVDLNTLQYISEADLERMGVSLLAQRRQLLAAVKTQNLYLDLTARIKSLEAENDEMREAQAAQGHSLAGTTASLAEMHLEAERLSKTLDAETERSDRLERDLRASNDELRGTRLQLEKAEEKATAFAADVDVLLSQLHSTSAGQKESLKEMRSLIEREGLSLQGDIRALKAGERPPPRRMSGVRRVSSDGGRRLSTDGGVVSRPSVVLMAPQPSSTFAAAPGVAGAAFSTSQPNQS